MSAKRSGILILAAAMCQISSGTQSAGPRQETEPVKLIESIRGPDLYRSYCAVCHGVDARGKGPMAPALKAAPTNLTSLTKRNKGKFPAEMVRMTISGEQLAGLSHGSRDMPVWGPVFSQVTRDQDLGLVRIDNLVRYIETLQEK